jgi:hypothetical protein
MSIALMPYQVDLAAVQLLGSGAAGDTIEEIIDKQSEVIDIRNCQMADLGESPTLDEAMRQIGRGHLDELDGFMYGYAIEQFCEFYGRMLRNDQWSPTRFRVIDEVDATLRTVGVTQALPHDFNTWNPPIPIRSTSDFPVISTFDTAACERAAAQYARAIPALAESEWRSPVAQVASWLRHCRDRGAALVVFLY